MIKKYSKLLITLSIIGNLLLAGLVIKKLTKPAPDPERNLSKHPHYKSRTDVFNSLTEKKNGITFFGDSITEGFLFPEYFSYTPILNRGISGDVTKSMAMRTQNVIDCSPKKIFVMAGINDLKMGNNIDNIFDNYFSIVKSFLDNVNDVEVYIQSTLPINDCRGRLKERLVPINENVIELNNRLKKLANNKNIFYIDLHKKFLSNGEMNPEYSIDGIHLNSKGYKTWFKIVEPLVN